MLNFLKSIFTWWNGATIGARFHIGRRGVFVGQDERGNRYFEAKDNTDKLLDMLLAKKRAGDRKEWLEKKGNLAEI